MDDEVDDPAEFAKQRLSLYVESLRIRMPEAQYELLRDVLKLWAENGGGTIKIHMDDEERALFTPEVQREVLVIMGLMGALASGHEDRADHVVVDLGDGAHVKGAQTLVPPDTAADPERLAAMRDSLDRKAAERSRDQAELDAIARASGMLPEEDPE
ncbi:hypothetical protein [Yinghuangia soli]|uniref:Uncharacterized protein n=1 Tax=Yinghuangia soli TaxID=2908204 RepID=A0AA41U141_9ACTN|nr:hypothetical protein [Yinghuangia soli]MCF2525749.1 hypothetical protein [Yinghuangia soli]